MEYKINMGDIFRIERKFGINLLSNERYKPMKDILDEKEKYLKSEKMFLRIMETKDKNNQEPTKRELEKMQKILEVSRDYDRRYIIEEMYIMAETYFAYLDIDSEKQRNKAFEVLNYEDLKDFDKALQKAFTYHFKPRKIGTSERDKDVEINGEPKKIPDKSILWHITFAVKELGMSYEEVIKINPGILIDVINQSQYLFPRKETHAVGKQ